MVRVIGSTPASDDTKCIEMNVLLKYFSNLWRTSEKLQTNCETNLRLTWSENCTISKLTGPETYSIKDTKLYLTLPTKDTENYYMN